MSGIANKLFTKSRILKIICQENFNFSGSDNRYKENHAAENRIKNPYLLKNYVNLFNVESFFVHELPPLVFKKIFSHIALFCDDTDDFSFYKYSSNLKSDFVSTKNIAIGGENDMSQIFMKLCVFYAYVK